MRLSLRVAVRQAHRPEEDRGEDMAGIHYVYILRCADGSFYVGCAQNLDARLKAHNDGRGAA